MATNTARIHTTVRERPATRCTRPQPRAAPTNLCSPLPMRTTPQSKGLLRRNLSCSLTGFHLWTLTCSLSPPESWLVPQAVVAVKTVSMSPTHTRPQITDTVQNICRLCWLSTNLQATDPATTGTTSELCTLRGRRGRGGGGVSGGGDGGGPTSDPVAEVFLRSHRRRRSRASAAAITCGLVQPTYRCRRSTADAILGRSRRFPAAWQRTSQSTTARP